jgi:ubiquinone/menaquinone biosynthesis C-methylase UbiE
MQNPVALAHEAIHETVENILKNESRGQILDVPAGEGALALRLKNLGFDVKCSDLYTEIFKLPDTEIKRGNLDERLPFDDNSFDYIVCVEGLEHIENPANAMREFARMLKNNGTLIVSVPNIMNIEERLKWLFNGYTSHFKPLSTEALMKISKEFGGMEEIALHVNPIGYSEVRFLLEKNGFESEKTYLDKPKQNSWLFLPIVGLIKLVSRFSSEKKRKSRWTDELNSNEVLLGGNTLIFKARKI